MKLYRKISQSVRYWSIMKYRTKYINPEIRELLEDFNQKKRIKINNQIVEDESQVEKIKETYEYKVFQHFEKINFFKSKEKSSDFLQYCDFKIFYEKERWTNGWHNLFYTRIRHTPKDFVFTKFSKILLFFLALFAFKLGFTNGYKDSKLYDEIKENILDVKTEDDLLALLTYKKLPLVVLYYIPGDASNLRMQLAQGKLIEEYGENYAIMAKVNCKNNLELCLKKSNYLTMPQWELMYPPFVDNGGDSGPDLQADLAGVKRFPIVPCKNDRSYQGLEGFLMENGVIPDRYNPVFVVGQSMRKYL